MAYRLSALNKAYDKDYWEDSEYGAGPKLLASLVSTDTKFATVFCIRYYGGKHLGGTRFEIISDLAVEVLNKLKNNDITTSKLPLRQMLHVNNPRTKRSKNKQKGGMREAHPLSYPRGGHTTGSNSRFQSAAYKRYSLMNKDSEETDWEQMMLLEKERWGDGFVENTHSQTQGVKTVSPSLPTHFFSTDQQLNTNADRIPESISEQAT